MEFLGSIEVGENAPDEFNVMIEIPKGSKNKYEIDEESGEIWLDRVLHTPLAYPTNYGFIPRSMYMDGDPLDVLVWSRASLEPKCIVKVKPLGFLRMIDKVKGEKTKEELDDKILAVPVDDPFFNDTNTIEDVPEQLLKEISHFFKRYKELEKEKVSEVKGWHTRKEAKEQINRSLENYEKKFSS